MPRYSITYTNVDPITDETKGPILTIASNSISSGDQYTLKKYLILATNQVVNYTLNICGIAKPSPVFSFESTASRVLKLVNSPAREGCATVNFYTITAGTATCSTMAYTMKSESTVMTENNAYSQVRGLQWKNDSGYSICWKFMVDKNEATNLPVGTYSMIFTATYTITDDFSTNLSTAYNENYSIEVLNCSSASVVNFTAPTTWITDFGGTGTSSTIFLETAANPSF